MVTDSTKQPGQVPTKQPGLVLTKLTAANLAGAVKVINAAFNNDPVTRFLHEPNEYHRAVYAASKETFHRWACLSAIAKGHATLLKVPGSSSSAGDEKDVVRAIALWFPPGTSPSVSSVPYLDALRLFWTTGPRVAKRVYWDLEPSVGAAKACVLKKYGVEKTYWYLFILAADPAFQGTGLGGRLLRDRTEKADAEGAHIFLESSNPENVPFYEKHGFVEEETVLVAGRVPMVMMIRPPR